MTSSHDNSLRVWDLQSGEQIGNEWLEGGTIVALSPDGKKVVSGSADGAVKLWDIDIGKANAKWTGHTRFVTSVCWNRDDGRVISGSKDGTARVWDVESGKTVLTIETGFTYVEAAIYCQDDTMIVTGGENKKE